MFLKGMFWNLLKLLELFILLNFVYFSFKICKFCGKKVIYLQIFCKCLVCFKILVLLYRYEELMIFKIFNVLEVGCGGVFSF